MLVSLNINFYMKRVRSRNSQSDELRTAIREINTLKQDFFEIKKLLKDLKNNTCKTNNGTTQTLEDFRTEFNALSINMT